MILDEQCGQSRSKALRHLWFDSIHLGRIEPRMILAELRELNDALTLVP